MAGEADISYGSATYAFSHQCGATKEIGKAHEIIVLTCTLPRGHRGRHECKRILDLLEEGNQVTTSLNAVSRWDGEK